MSDRLDEAVGVTQTALASDRGALQLLASGGSGASRGSPEDAGGARAREAYEGDAARVNGF